MKALSLFLLISLVLSESAWAHARLAANSVVVPRNNNPGLKTAPCGGIARTATPVVLTAGATVTIRWEETINHTGSYFIEFSPANDTNWQRLKTIPDVQNGGGLPHLYTDTVTVPNVPCTSCTIRLVQEMIDNHPEMPTYYYSCGDIQIVSNGGTPNPTPTVMPTVPDDYGGGSANCDH